jgi:hypothetical protein
MIDGVGRDGGGGAASQQLDMTVGAEELDDEQLTPRWKRLWTRRYGRLKTEMTDR